MAPAALPRNTNVSHHAADSSASDEYSRALPPNAVQLGKEMFVILEMSHLVAITRCILLQRPVWRRGHHKMDRGVRDPRQIPGVPEPQVMRRAMVWLRPCRFTVMGVGFEECPKALWGVVFERKGRCPSRLSCRFAFEKTDLRRAAVCLRFSQPSPVG